uniref:transmembrane protein 114 isoform X2 n=1 Tax=Euleptes europaea TaxID=460621 RepID=UPI002540A69C|nr:transmembrane protein 114 isoform X2 [Euleptes europaea]
MKVTLNVVSLLAALLGILSFVFLAVAIGTDFWYVKDASKLEELGKHADTLSSHSGLWRTCGFNNECLPLVNPFQSARPNITSSHRQVLTLLTLAGVSVYIAHSAAAFKEAVFLLGGTKLLEGLRIRYGWSMALAWLSFATEVLTGLAFLLAARMVALQRKRDCSI